MATIQTLVDELRVRLQETTARQWSDASQLIPYAYRSQQWWSQYLNRIEGGSRFRYTETFTVAASTELYAVSGLTKTFDRVIELSTLVGNILQAVQPFNDGEESELRNVGLGGSILVPKYGLQDDSIVFLPTGPARTYRIRYGYKAPLGTSAGTTLLIPDDYIGDVVQRALHFAQADAGLTNNKFEEEYAVRLGEIEDLERSRLYGAVTERVRVRAGTFSRCR